jgi:serine/threonine-protein kinase
MRNDLLRAVAGQRVEATPVMGDEERTTILGAAPAAYGYGPDYGPEDGWSDEDEEAYRRQRRRRMVLIGSIVGVLVIAGVVAAVLALNGGGGGTQRPPAVATVAVPNVVGQDQAAATQALRNQGLEVSASTQPSTAGEKGQVLKTTPAGGAQVKKGSTVALVVGAGPNTLSIPDVVGQTVSDAKSAIQAKGFTGNITVNEVDSLESQGQVVSTEPSANSDVAPDTTIVLNVSKGTITVPDVTGRSESSARQKLVSAGIDPKQIESVDVERDDVAAGTVVSSTPTAGQTIGADDTITLQIARPTPPQPTTPTATPTTTTTTPPTTTPASSSSSSAAPGAAAGGGAGTGVGGGAVTGNG